MGTIIAALIAVAGVGISTAVSASSADKAMKMEETAWREQMEKDEAQRRKDNLARQRQMLENTINRNEQYKKSVASAWSGRRAA